MRIPLHLLLVPLLPLASSPALAVPRIDKQLDAAQLVVAHGMLIALEGNFQFVRGHDASGRQRWRTRYQTTATGTQALFVHDGRVLIHAGNRVLPIDAKSGRLRSPGASVPYLATPGVPGCWLNQSHGACAYSCPCSFRFAACESGAPLGASYGFHRLCRRNWNKSGSSCGCWGSSGNLIGRSGSTLIAQMDRPSGGRGKRRRYGAILLGADAQSGKELWRRDARLSSPATWINGLSMTADGLTCWSGDSRGRLEVFACATGKRLWVLGPEVQGWAEQAMRYFGALRQGGIVVYGSAQIACYAERTGKLRWRRSTRQDAFVLVSGLHGAPKVFETKARALTLLDPRSGKPRGSFSLDAPATLHDRGERLLLVDGRRLRVLSVGVPERARARAQRPAVVATVRLPAAFQLHAGRSVVLAKTARGLRAFGLPALKPLGKLDGAYTVVAIEAGLGSKRVLLQKGSRYYLVSL